MPHLNIALYNPVSLSYQGGGERWILEVATRLLARGHKITVLTTRWKPSKSDCRYESFKNINLVEMRYVRFFRGFAFPVLDLNKLIKEFNSSDVVYFFVYPPNELMGWALRRKIHTPLIGGVHTFLAPKKFFIHNIYSPFFKKALSSFKSLHVLNRSTANLMNYWGHLNTYFIPNGVDTNVFRLENTIDNDTFNVLYTGRLTEDKGADVLLEIVRYTNEKLNINDIKFTICGFGPLQNLVRETAEKYANVEYLGFVPSEAFPQVYAKSNLFLIPSVSEGMPLRLLEAQSCGLPVVGSRIPGIIDLISEGNNGILIDTGDVKDFAQAIKKYYEFWTFSTNKYCELKKAIRERMTTEYDWNIIITRLEEMFRKSVLLKAQ